MTNLIDGVYRTRYETLLHILPTLLSCIGDDNFKTDLQLYYNSTLVMLSIRLMNCRETSQTVPYIIRINGLEKLKDIYVDPVL